MKLVTAIIKPHTADAVRAALDAVGISGLTMTQVHGYGRQKGHTEIYRAAEYTIEAVPKLRLEVVVADDHLEQVLTTIVEHARTNGGSIGDGKIWVTPVETLIRVRTGERDTQAL